MLPTGCSTLIADSGKNLGELKTREQVHTYFGEPAKTGTADGKDYEVYYTHRKIAEGQLERWSKGMGIAMTLGMLELYYFPEELVYLAKHTLAGQEMTFVYNDTGRTISIMRNYNEQMYAHELRDNNVTAEVAKAHEITVLPIPRVVDAPPTSNFFNVPILKANTVRSVSP
jgi:hypothetical protein